MGRFTSWLARNLYGDEPTIDPEPAHAGRNVAIINPSTLSAFGATSGASILPHVPEQGLAVPAVYAAVRMITSDVSRVPWASYLVSTNQRIVEQPAILRRPDPFYPVPTTRRQLAASLLLRGNAFAWLTAPDRAGRPTVAVPINNDEVHVTWNDQRTRPRYTWRGTELVLNRDLMHLKYIDLGPGHLLGLGPIQAARVAVQGAIYAEQFAEGFYAEGGVPPGVLTVPGELTKPEADIISEQWNAARQDSRKSAVLPRGTTWAPTQIDASDMQFVESRMHSVGDVARLFGIPGAKLNAVMGGSNLTYTSLESLQSQYLLDAVSVPYEILEVGFGELLPVTQEVRGDYEALMRPDSRTRFSVYALALQNGIYTINEVRAREGLPPVAGGDEIRRPEEAPEVRERNPSNVGEAG